MAPWVSVVLPVYKSSDEFIKLLLPIDTLKVVDSAAWYWVPQIGDAVTYDNGSKNTLLKSAGICTRPIVDIIQGVWDFRVAF